MDRPALPCDLYRIGDIIRVSGYAQSSFDYSSVSTNNELVRIIGFSGDCIEFVFLNRPNYSEISHFFIHSLNVICRVIGPETN